MRLLLTLLLCLPLLAQDGVTIQFSPQGSWLGFDAHLVTLFNRKLVAQNFHSGLIRNEAMRRGISPAGYSLIQRELTDANRTSPVRIMLSATEAAGWGMGVLVATDSIWQPAANWQKALPIVGAGLLRLATTLTARHAPAEAKLPADLLPPYISLPAGPGAYLEYTMLAVPQ